MAIAAIGASLVVVTATAPSGAQEPSWRLVGPDGGYISLMAGSTNYLLAVAYLGLYRSTDRGERGCGHQLEPGTEQSQRAITGRPVQRNAVRRIGCRADDLHQLGALLVGSFPRHTTGTNQCRVQPFGRSSLTDRFHENGHRRQRRRGRNLAGNLGNPAAGAGELDHRPPSGRPRGRTGKREQRGVPHDRRRAELADGAI